MVKLNFEKNLSHQIEAIESITQTLENIEIIEPQGSLKEQINPIFNLKDNARNLAKNIRRIQEENKVEININKHSNIIDVQMETGTGKTYTYTKTIFELNKLYNIFKFIIVVPTLAIKAGTIDFLTSQSAREHFKEHYGKTINAYIVESKKQNKKSKSYMPQSISQFVNSTQFEKNSIQVLVINQGMINSKTMEESFDKTLFDTITVPFNALSKTQSVMIIDEPHKFKKDKKTWENLQKITPQLVLRYGATFIETENLVYQLTAIESFNRNLVKGVIGHSTEFEEGKNSIIRFVNSNGVEVTFEKIEGNLKIKYKLIKGDSLEKVHPQMNNLYIEKINKTEILLSNGLILKKSESINPYSYSQTLQENMIKRAIQEHFKLEEKFFNREVKIKPLSLFFIDNIKEYRNQKGNTRLIVEKYIKIESEEHLKITKNETYKEYLKKTLEDISKTHGGYFAEDKTENDEVIEKEMTEILHEKEELLNFENPRRFIFSKWTLREGWDNPNIFQICKLRSSGSEISKLQEVGRGLRLPVNEFGNRVKDEQFYLNYFVDFTENEFIEKLRNEIIDNSRTNTFEENPTKLTEDLIKRITLCYNILEEDLLERLDENNIIKRNNDFINEGFEFIKKNYSKALDGQLDTSKIRKSTDVKRKISIRVEKYPLLKELWEKINQKVLLEYNIKDEEEFEQLFIDFLNTYPISENEGYVQKIQKLEIEDKNMILKEETAIYANSSKTISTLPYSKLLKELSKSLYINIKTLHRAFERSNVNINLHLNQNTIFNLKKNFDDYLTLKAFSKFEIDYQKITNSVHPTCFTNSKGEVLDEIDSSTIGTQQSNEKVPENYFLSELYFDSNLEKENIINSKTSVVKITVFTKIPKNSIRIPIAGGKSYSPDFAYVVEYEDGSKKINFVIETKDTNEQNLRSEEKLKIEHAKKLFGNKFNIIFKAQFEDKGITSIIREVIQQV